MATKKIKEETFFKSVRILKILQFERNSFLLSNYIHIKEMHIGRTLTARIFYLESTFLQGIMY